MSDYVFVVLHIEPRGYWEHQTIAGIRTTKAQARKLRAEYAINRGLIENDELLRITKCNHVNYIIEDGFHGGITLRIEKHPLTDEE